MNILYMDTCACIHAEKEIFTCKHANAPQNIQHIALCMLTQIRTIDTCVQTEHTITQIHIHIPQRYTHIYTKHIANKYKYIHTYIPAIHRYTHSTQTHTCTYRDIECADKCKHTRY